HSREIHARLTCMRERHRDLLERTYDAFNARNIEEVLRVLHADVDWPNGMEGGYLHGRDAVREYWTRQWRMIDPHLEPPRFTVDERDRVIVLIPQIVRDLTGRIVTEQMVQHVYQFDDGLIRRMEIRK